MVRRLCFFIVFLSFFVCCFAKVKSYDEIMTLLGKKSETSFFLESVSFKSDVPFSKTEFVYLTSLHEHCTVSYDQFYLAYKHLYWKKAFASIDINVNDGKLGKKIEFILRGYWIFKRVKLKGVWFGRHRYEQCYTLQPGEIFDGEAHEDSLKAIKTVLQEQGYLNHRIEDELIYNSKDKSITVNIEILRGNIFRIVEVSCKIIGGSFFIFENRVNEVLKPLSGADYTHWRVVKYVDKIKQYAREQGVRHCDIVLKKKINKKKGIIEIDFELKIHKQINIIFVGNYFLTDKELYRVLEREGQSEWISSSEIYAQLLLREYYRQGYWNASIRIKKDGNRGVRFFVKEGKLARINAVIVKDQKGAIGSKNKFFFQDVLEHHCFNEELLDIAFARMKTFYIAHGFWDFEIIEKRFIKNGHAYNIEVVVEKGLQRFFFDSDSEGKEKFVPFDPKILEQKYIKLIRCYQRKGYWYASAVSKIIPLSSNAFFDGKERICFRVKWDIKRGEKVAFGKILLRGSTKVPFKKILRVVDGKPGENWERRKLDVTRRNLKKIDVFSHIVVQPYKLSKKDGRKPIVISLLDDDPLELRFRSGYFLTSKNFLFKRESTAKLGGSIILKNPFNQGDKCECNIDWTRFERRFVFDYGFPQFLTKDCYGKVKGYSHLYVHPASVGDNKAAYEAMQNGFLIGLETEYRSDSFLGVTIGNEWVKTSRVRGNLNLSNRVVDRSLPYFFIEPSIVNRNIDDQLDPHRGTTSFLSLKMILPERVGGPCCRVQVEGAFFVPVTKEIVFAGRTRLGHILKKSFNTVMPIERFYLGGAQTVRGYAKDLLPPLGMEILENDNGDLLRQYTIQGGSTMVNANAEIRFPIYKSFGGVLFQDVGVLSQEGFEGLSKRWYPTSGFGLRYKTPIGALRFDMGWKWKRFAPEESMCAWYLTLGHAF